MDLYFILWLVVGGYWLSSSIAIGIAEIVLFHVVLFRSGSARKQIWKKNQINVNVNTLVTEQTDDERKSIVEGVLVTLNKITNVHPKRIGASLDVSSHH
jgi:hypothetical protein